MHRFGTCIYDTFDDAFDAWAEWFFEPYLCAAAAEDVARLRRDIAECRAQWDLCAAAVDLCADETYEDHALSLDDTALLALARRHTHA